MVVRQNTKKNCQYAKKNKNFLPTPHLKFKFYTTKQKQLLAQLAKIKKKNLVLSTQFVALVQQKKTKILQNLIQNLKKEIDKNQIEIQKISKLYNFFFSALQELSLKKNNKRKLNKHRVINAIQRQKIKLF